MWKETCPICKKDFSKGALKGHIAAVHEGKRPFVCDSCDSTFATNDGLKTHTEMVHEGKKN